MFLRMGLGILVAIGIGVAAQAQTYQKTFEDWVVACNTINGVERCEMNAQFLTQDDNLWVKAHGMREQDGGITMMLTLPPVAKARRLIVLRGEHYIYGTLPIKECTVRACVAFWHIPQPKVAELLANKWVTIDYSVTETGGVRMQLDLNGFPEALKTIADFQK